MLFPEDIRGINVILGTHVVISINKRDESTPRDIIYAVLAAMKNIKRVVLVDGDIDIYDPIEVEWAILARVTPGKDVIIIPSTKGLPTFDKWGIDATAPLSGEPFGKHWLFNKAVPPGVSEVDYV